MNGDLFGEPLTTQTDHPLTAGGKRKPAKAQGYAAMPGSGPEGETCGSCKHHCIRRYSKNYHKYGLMRAFWTGGTATDIRVGAAACRLWEAGTATEEFGG